jgi:hypothetical protein
MLKLWNAASVLWKHVLIRLGIVDSIASYRAVEIGLSELH